MSSDDLPSDKPLMFNTFSGPQAPIEAYDLLSAEEAQQRLTDRDKEEYKDPEFELVVRSRIWGELKQSVAERREMYLEREHAKMNREALQNENIEKQSDSDNNNDEETQNTDDDNSPIDDDHTTHTEHKQEDENIFHIVNISNDQTVDSNISNNAHNNGSTFADSDDNNEIKEEEDEETDHNEIIEQTFANPFTPFQQVRDTDNNGDKYAIPFDVFDSDPCENIDNHNNDSNSNHIHTEQDDIWANWRGFDNKDHDSRDSNISSNDNVYNHTPRKLRKSEVFADPFHWDTDDETNHNTIDDIETDEQKEIHTSQELLLIDINAPFKDPFHGTPKKPNNAPQNNDIHHTNDINDGSTSHNELFASPFENSNIQDRDSSNNSYKTKNEDLLRLLFGEDITTNHSDHSAKQFASPFHKNDTESSDALPLSPMIPFNPQQHSDHDDDHLHANSNPFMPQIVTVSSVKPSETPTPFKISTETPKTMTPSFNLTPIPLTTATKRASAVMELDTKIFRDIVQETLEYSPKASTEHTQTESLNDETQQVKEATPPVIKQPAPKKDSLDFSWNSDNSGNSIDIIRQPTPPPAKTLNDELYELLATLLATFMQNPKAHYMTNGVPWQKWGCLDWPQYIKQPHTLIQVRNALDNNEYHTPGQFAVAVRNVFRNYARYHWKGAGQYRVNTRATILWEQFDGEYFQILHDESEERKENQKREDSRKRAIDEARERNDSREREFSNTHTVSTDLEEEEEESESEAQKQDSLMPDLLKQHTVTSKDTKVSFAEDMNIEHKSGDEEYEEMMKLHYEMSVHLNTRPTTPQPPAPYLDFHSTDPDLPVLGLNTLNTVVSQQVHNGPSPVADAGYNHTNGSRRVSLESMGAISVNSRNVRFQSPGQAQRALRITNVMDSLSRTGSVSSITSIFRKKKAKTRFDLTRAALLAKISKNLPDGFNPHQRRGSIIRNTATHRNGDLNSALDPTLKLAVKSKSSVSNEVELGERHRASKELIDDFSPQFKAYRASDATLPQMNEMPNLDLELQKTLDEGLVPEPYSHLKYEAKIIMCLCVLILIYHINYRLFSDQMYPLLHPMTNVGARITAVFTEPLFIICMLGSMIVVHLQYRTKLVIRYKNLFIVVFVIANLLNILRVSIAHCAMDFIYDLYIYLIIMCTMILPFFCFDDRWKESDTVFILFVMWIGVILIGFVFLILHQYFTGFILITFYLLIILWIVRFLYYKSLGVFDDIGNLSARYDIGYCCLLIPALLLFPQLAAAILAQLSNIKLSYSSIVSSIYGYYILLKLTFCVARSLWETTALKGTDLSRYMHFMFPIFFIEELLDTFLLIKLKFSWEIIGLLILMALNHMLRDSDIGYRVIYKQYMIPFITSVYYNYYNKSDSQRNLYLVQARSLGAPQKEDEENDKQMEIDIDITNADELYLDAANETSTKELNLAQERDDIHIARIILHFQMIQFSEYASRICVLFLIVMDIMCDGMQIGKRLLVMEKGSVNENQRGLLILLCFLSLMMIFCTNIMCQRLLSQQALTSIQCLEKLKLINEFSYKEKLYIHQWVIFGDDCEIFKRFWIFFAFIVGYQWIILSQAFFTNYGLVSICDAFF